MKTLDMPVDSQHGGTFWLASDDPEQAVHGVLRRTASNLTLEVYESLTSLLREVRRSQLPDGSVAVDYAFADDEPEERDLVIHGRLDNGVAVTLVDCFTSARRGETQTLSPLYMLYGLHASGGDAVFTKARVRLRHLDEWLSLPGFRLDVQPDSTSTLSYSRPVTEQVALGSGGRLSVHLEQKAAAVTATGGSITRNAAFQVEPREPLSWREIGRSVVVPLQTLLSLCTLRECPPGLVQVEQTGTGWATVISRRMSAGASPITTTTHHFLVSFSDIRLHGVARWLDSVERLGPLPPVVARAIADRSSVMLETQLLELTTVAEGLHRRLFPNATRMSDAIANRVRQATSDALCAEAEETQSVVTGMFRHLTEPGYNARMKDLAALAEPLLPFVTGKTNRWSRRVEESRNTFAHRSHGFLEHDVDEELTIAESLSWVLAGVLLAQAGCTHTTVNDDPTLVQPYAYFMKRAKRRLPHVFREV